MALSTLPHCPPDESPSNSATQTRPWQPNLEASDPRPPGLWVINSAFLQEIKDSNPNYWVALRRLPETCVETDEPMVACNLLTRAIDDLRDAVALQFSLEESYGFVEVRRIRSTRRIRLDLHEKAVKLQQDHRRLYLELSELAEQAEELQYRGARPALLRQLMARTLEFEAKLRQHERAETELIRLSVTE